MYQVIGTKTYSMLLADPQGAEVIAISCEPGNGDLAQGQIMYKKSSGFYAPAATGNIVSTNKLVVLDEAVSTSGSLTVAENARAFSGGRLLKSKLLVSGGTALTAAQELVLRTQGINLDVMDTPDNTFDNARKVITYDANGGTGDDVVAYADPDSTYTIADNTFTPPSGKTFSTWNTAADGSGTAYAPAATYTATADLTLYAIWA